MTAPITLVAIPADDTPMATSSATMASAMSSRTNLVNFILHQDTLPCGKAL